MDINLNLKHWQLRETDGVAHLMLNVIDSPLNVLNTEVLAELEQVVAFLEQNPVPCLVLSSSKKEGFLAGADVSEFVNVSTDEDMLALLQRGQNLFLRFERLPFITVAAIHGACLGGGLELALACNYRVADEDNSCKLALPEVKLGIHPGYGGVVRLPRLINSFEAINLMLTGKMINGKAAKKLGLVDIATQQRYLLDVASQLARGDIQIKRKGSITAPLFNIKAIRVLVAKIIRKKLVAKVNPEHYPAPYHLLDFWVAGVAGDEAAYLAEAKSVLSIAQVPAGRRAMQSLVKIFLLDKQVKASAKHSDFKAQHVHIVGAGVMGGDIAAWCAMRGFTVTLQDASLGLIAPAIARANKLFNKRLKQAHLVTAAMDRLLPDPNALGVPKADVVIEAITERLEAKRGLFAALEPRMKTSAILASNTSSIALEKLSANLARPERLVGIHFFNPVAMMPLVEVVRGEQSSDAVVNDALAFVNAIGKTPLEVKSAPGFLVNRVLMTYMAEAMRLYEEGVRPEAIDQAAVNFGMPLGPIELADVVGLDICQAVASEIITAFGGEDSGVCQRLVDEAHLGKKSGQGFYQWQQGKAVKRPTSSGDEAAITERLIYAFMNECVACLNDGIVADANGLDLGLIFGTGFAPFRGGPIGHIQALGVDEILATYTRLEQQFGARFAANEGWEKLPLQQHVAFGLETEVSP